MFSLLQNKVGVLNSYRRLRAQWDRLQSDASAFEENLSGFLDEFQGMHKYMDSSTAVDKVYGDCTEILATLLTWCAGTGDEDADPLDAKRHIVDPELTLRTLSVVELIARDVKYRAQLAELPYMLLVVTPPC